MKAIDAALTILREANAALHYKTLAAEAIRRGLWTTTAVDPATAMAAALSSEIARKGTARIRRLGNGAYIARPPLGQTPRAPSAEAAATATRTQPAPVGDPPHPLVLLQENPPDSAADRDRVAGDALVAREPLGDAATRREGRVRLRSATVNVGDCRLSHGVMYQWFENGLGHDAREVGVPVVHDLRLEAPCWKVARPFPHACAGRDCEMPVTLARVQVNEFPRHIATTYDEWFWQFDICPHGPSEPLGVMLDVLRDQPWAETRRQGAILHFQALEFQPDIRPEALGPDFLRAACWLLSRSRFDVAIAETRRVKPSLPLLWPQVDVEQEEPTWRQITPAAATILAECLRRAGFRRFEPEGDPSPVAPALQQQLGMAREDDGVSYYLPVRYASAFRRAWGGIAGPRRAAVLDTRDMDDTEHDVARGYVLDDEGWVDAEHGDSGEAEEDRPATTREPTTPS